VDRLTSAFGPSSSDLYGYTGLGMRLTKSGPAGILKTRDSTTERPPLMDEAAL